MGVVLLQNHVNLQRAPRFLKYGSAVEVALFEDGTKTRLFAVGIVHPKPSQLRLKIGK